MAGIAPLAPSAHTVGPLAHSVADVVLLFKVMTRPLPKTIGGRRRIGVIHQYFSDHPEIAAIGENVLEWLAAAGVAMVDIGLPHDLLPDARVDVVDNEFKRAFDFYFADNFASGAAASVAALDASGAFLINCAATLERRLVSLADRPPYELLLERPATVLRAITTAMRRHDLDALLYPTSAALPTTLANPYSGSAIELAAWTGLPAPSFPAGRESINIPIGFELLGDRTSICPTSRPK